MFERYTERARRVIFFARYEASQFGSSTIESEHLLLGLVREGKETMQRFVAANSLRKTIEERLAVGPKISVSIDLPLSNECRRILAYSSEEAERLAHSHIGTEHLLLGILREEGSLAAQVLKDAGAHLQSIREALAKDPARSEPASATADRPEIHALIDELPESSLGLVKMMMDRMAGGRLPLVSTHQEMQRDTEGKIREGRFTSFRQENGAIVVETQQFLHGHQISLTERLQVSEDGKTLTYSQEIVGPKPEQQHKHAMQFDVS